MKYLIKILISILLFVLILSNIELTKTLEAAKSVYLPLLALALAAILVSGCIAAFRWSIVMGDIGFTLPFRFYLFSYFKGSFFNQGLPTSVGGDGLRILDASRETDRKEDAFIGVFIDRIIGLGGLLLLNGFALVFNSTLLPKNIYHVLMVLTSLSLLGLVGLLFVHKLNWLTRYTVFAFIHRLSGYYHTIYSTIPKISLQLGLSILTHLFAMCAFYLIGTGVGLTFDLQVYLSLVPPVILLTILPISLAGWGVREGAMVGLFVLVGADKELVLLLSILYGLSTLVASLPGLLIFITQKQQI